ncbi:MAG: hypothetical protein HDR19_02620 [Lachnospiraceae bacterium]|nr:hypothetical protein [Lachnospiraceae bacterium]
MIHDLSVSWKGMVKTMLNGIKYTYRGNPFWTHLKKHFCPNCGTKVKFGRERKIVNSRSYEAKFYDFSCGDTFLIGDVEFRIRCFYCPNCDINISFDDMKKYERTT